MDDSDGSSEFEIPYAMDFSSDDQKKPRKKNSSDNMNSSEYSSSEDSGICLVLSPGRSRAREPLRAGDCIAYTCPIFTSGSALGERQATVVGVDPTHAHFPLILDNCEQLPWDTFVQRIGEFYKGQVRPHPGRRKLLSHFVLKASRQSRQSLLASALQARAARTRGVLQRVERDAMRAYSTGILPSNMTTKTTAKTTPRPRALKNTDISTTTTIDCSTTSRPGLVSSAVGTSKRSRRQSMQSCSSTSSASTDDDRPVRKTTQQHQHGKRKASATYIRNTVFATSAPKRRQGTNHSKILSSSASTFSDQDRHGPNHQDDSDDDDDDDSSVFLPTSRTQSFLTTKIMATAAAATAGGKESGSALKTSSLKTHHKQDQCQAISEKPGKTRQEHSLSDDDDDDILCTRVIPSYSECKEPPKKRTPPSSGLLFFSKQNNHSSTPCSTLPAPVVRTVGLVVASLPPTSSTNKRLPPPHKKDSSNGPGSIPTKHTTSLSSDCKTVATTGTILQSSALSNKKQAPPPSSSSSSSDDDDQISSSEESSSVLLVQQAPRSFKLSRTTNTSKASITAATTSHKYPAVGTVDVDSKSATGNAWATTRASKRSKHEQQEHSKTKKMHKNRRRHPSISVDSDGSADEQVPSTTTTTSSIHVNRNHPSGTQRRETRNPSPLTSTTGTFPTKNSNLTKNSLPQTLKKSVDETLDLHDDDDDSVLVLDNMTAAAAAAAVTHLGPTRGQGIRSYVDFDCYSNSDTDENLSEENFHRKKSVVKESVSCLIGKRTTTTCEDTRKTASTSTGCATTSMAVAHKSHSGIHEKDTISRDTDVSRRVCNNRQGSKQTNVGLSRHCDSAAPKLHEERATSRYAQLCAVDSDDDDEDLDCVSVTDRIVVGSARESRPMDGGKENSHDQKTSSSNRQQHSTSRTQNRFRSGSHVSALPSARIRASTLPTSQFKTPFKGRDNPVPSPSDIISSDDSTSPVTRGRDHTYRICNSKPKQDALLLSSSDDEVDETSSRRLSRSRRASRISDTRPMLPPSWSSDCEVDSPPARTTPRSSGKMTLVSSRGRDSSPSKRNRRRDGTKAASFSSPEFDFVDQPHPLRNRKRQIMVNYTTTSRACK